MARTAEPASPSAVAEAQSETESGSVRSRFSDERQAAPLLQGLLCIVSALEGADIVLLQGVFYALSQDLGLTMVDLSVVALCQGLLQACAGPFWGVLADRGVFSRKAILIFGSLGQGTLTCLLALAQSLAPILVLRSLSGVMLASLRPVGNGVLADVTSEIHRGKVFGWIFFSLNIGMVVSSIVATNLSRQCLGGTKEKSRLGDKTLEQCIGGIEGWRVAFLIFGASSLLNSILLTLFFVEPEREGAKLQSRFRGLFAELLRLLSYLRMPTFLALIIQGCFGCIPWNALGYRILFFQVSGLSDLQSSILQAIGQASAAFGSLMGGMLADFVTSWLPIHGRPLVAQASVLLGLPFAILTFTIIPEAGSWAFWYFFIMVTGLGLTASWCATGVNLPILSEIVPADSRSAVIAWQSAFEGAFAAVLGNAAVGLLAEKAFHFSLSKAQDELAKGKKFSQSIGGLGSALTITLTVPWVICFFLYSLLHWSYPRDLRAKIMADKAEQDGEGNGDDPARTPCDQEHDDPGESSQGTS